ncbi:arrestin domain-containing protein 4 isoform X2 [Molothrus ater]|uniref:arrestin domain-containing protein 4 isoform X2 n=1 Tax=Molothrus ater TaxID=84834 RepID=UPI0023E8EDDD|nr:arrestin domain-containing protein 4 isoform X2 [Molothrus ater]
MAAAGPGPGAGGAVKTLALVLEDEARRGGGGGYCSGDTVSGQVLLELAGPLPLRGLRLEAAGRARVAWSESPGAVPGAGTWGVAVRAPGPGPRREAEVRYLDIRQSLLRDPPEGEENLILLDGRHEFPFSFQLPQEPLVTSFTGKYGSIQYYVKAVLERPAVPDQSVQTELQIISHIDVSSPALLTPVLRSQEKMVGCWFFTSGPVSLSAKIERKGYCNAPPNYADVVSEEEFSRHVPAYPPPIDCEEQLCCPVFAYIQEFRFQPPPLYSEIDPHPTDVEEVQPVSFML